MFDVAGIGIEDHVSEVAVGPGLQVLLHSWSAWATLLQIDESSYTIPTGPQNGDSVHGQCRYRNDVGSEPYVSHVVEGLRASAGAKKDSTAVQCMHE